MLESPDVVCNEIHVQTRGLLPWFRARWRGHAIMRQEYPQNSIISFVNNEITRA
jgi:hypothetical protein